MGNGTGTNGNGSSWRTAAISGLAGIVMLMSGWAYTDARAAQDRTTKEVQELVNAQRVDRERIATLEEANRNVRESLQRIETTVNEIRDRRR